MAALGYRTFDEMVGQTQRLEADPTRLHYKSRGLDLSPLLRPAHELNPGARGFTHSEFQDHEIDDTVSAGTPLHHFYP